MWPAATPACPWPSRTVASPCGCPHSVKIGGSIPFPPNVLTAVLAADAFAAPTTTGRANAAASLTETAPPTEPARGRTPARAGFTNG